MEEPFRSIRFGRLFLFQGLNFSVGYGRSKSRLRDMRRGVEDIFSVQPGQFHGGQKVPSWLFRKAPGRREGAVAPCRRPVLSNLAVFLIIQAYGQAFEHAILRAIPAAWCRREPGGSGIFLNMAGPVRSPIRFFLE